MYNFHFKDKIPPKISKWHIIKIFIYTAVLIILIALILRKINAL